MSTRYLAVFLVRRSLALIVLLFLVSLLVFALLYGSPGNSISILLGGRNLDPAALRALEHQYHLDQPLLVQYWYWLAAAVHLDFGRSIFTGQPVLSDLIGRFSLSLELVLYSAVLTIALGLPLGVIAAIKRGSGLDRAISALSVFGMSSPAFATGIFLLYLFGVVLSWFPVYGEGTGLGDRVVHLTLPAVALALTGLALVIKLTRAAMIQALEQDFVAFAEARGLSPRRILMGYAFRNSLGAIFTASGLVVNRMLFGTVVVEVTFALPGAGSLLVDSVTNKDIPVVQALALFIAAFILLVNLVVDIGYVFADPRIRFERVRS